jgi:hypothetical protein
MPEKMKYTRPTWQQNAGQIGDGEVMTLQAADEMLAAWLKLWVSAGMTDGEYPWYEDTFFAKARLQGMCHKLYIVVQPPFTPVEPGLHHVIVDWQDDGGPHTKATFRTGFSNYHDALRVAAPEIADENEREFSAT